MFIRNLLQRGRKKVAAVGKGISHLIRISLRRLNRTNTEESIAEFERLSGKGHSDGWTFDRDEAHERR